MKFVVIVLTLCLERFSDARTWLHRDEWFHAYVCAVRRPVPVNLRGWITPLLVILLPGALVLGVLYLVQGRMYGIPELGLSLVVLFYALGRVKLQHQLEDYLAHWRAGDLQSAYHHACEHLTEPEVANADDAGHLHQAVRRAYLHHALTGLFAVLFWYFLLGPAAAVLWMLCEQYLPFAEEDRHGRQVERIQHALEWLPARVLVLGFAVVGHFGGPLSAVSRDFLRWSPPIEGFVDAAAVAALDSDEMANPASRDFVATAENEWRSLQDLLTRCLVFILVVTAVATIFGWN